jgi:hypothetical protein
VGVVRACAAGVVLAFALSACGASQPGAEAAALRVVAEPDMARVYVDDRFIATARRLAVRPAPLRTGVHFVTVSADGYFPHDVELDLPAGETTVEITLRPVPP